jgi:lambda repressor-like predicted transcriptional regulator
MALAIRMTGGALPELAGMAGLHPATESQTMKKTPRKLSRELAWIIGIKVVLLLIIWKAFVAPYHAHVDADSSRQHAGCGTGQPTPGEKQC